MATEKPTHAEILAAKQIRAGDLVEATVASTKPRTIQVRVDREPWVINDRSTTLSDGKGVVAVLTDSIRVIESGAVRTVPARNGMAGYQVHALREGAPLPGGHRITHVEDYGSDTHVVVVGSDGDEHCMHRHTEIRLLDSGVAQLVIPEHAGWAAD